MTLVDILGLLPKVVAWNNIGWDIWAPISCFWYFQMNSTKLISYWKELTPWDNVFYLQFKSLDVQSPPSPIIQCLLTSSTHIMHHYFLTNQPCRTFWLLRRGWAGARPEGRPCAPVRSQCAPVRSELWPLALAADYFRIWSVWPQPIICLFLIHKRSSTATSHSQLVMHDQQNDCIFVWNILRDSQILNMIVIHVWMTMYIWESPRRSFQSAWYQCLPLTIKTCSKKSNKSSNTCCKQIPKYHLLYFQNFCLCEINYP